VNHFLYERCMSGVMVESQYMRQVVERASAKENPRVHVVPNGVDLGHFTPRTGRTGRRDGEGLVVGYVGRMSPEKNPLGFVELCGSLHAAVPSLSFRMSGDGPLETDVRRAIDESTTRVALHYGGFQPDVAAELRQLDVLVVPSKLDGCPNVVMEANACGIPVLGAPVGGIRELIEDGQNGYQVAPDDVGKIAELLRHWILEPEALAELKASSRRVAERKFDQVRMLDRYQQVFEEHLGAPA
jgi:glycosyltransferase involved in cell wall biosynthesis